jgi:hypothetical protein
MATSLVDSTPGRASELLHVREKGTLSDKVSVGPWRALTRSQLRVRGGEPTMAYIALDALREWEFEPARLDGEPIESFYTLTVNFRSAR